MYVIGRWEIERSVSLQVPEETQVEFSLSEFEHYCDVFEEMFERMDREESEGEAPWTSRLDDSDWDLLLDEFDRADIARMRESFGLIRGA